MLAGDGWTKHWMKLAQGEHAERDLEKQTPNFCQEARTLTGSLPRAITVAFPESVNRNKIQVCT